MDKYNIPGVKTFEYTKIIGLENIEFGKNIIIDDFVLIYAKGRVKIGNCIHIGAFSSLMGGEELIMDDFSGLSHGCRVFTRSEDFTDYGFGNPTISDKYRNIKSGPVHFGRFAVIGANSTICPGVKIGEGVAVAANSVVTRNLEPWGIYKDCRKVGERNKDGILQKYAEYLRNNTD